MCMEKLIWLVTSGVARNNGCVRLFYGQGSGGSSRDLESVYDVRNWKNNATKIICYLLKKMQLILSQTF